MKKIYLLLTLVMVSFVMSFAGDTIKVLRIYHNGSFTTIPLANIDSINHSMYDATGELQADYTTSIIEAFDSTYNIPIYEIDSVILANVDADEFKEFMVDVNDWIANVLNNEEEIGLEDFQRRLTDWLSECGWVAKTTKEENSNIITITYTNGLNSYIDFQDLSFFEDVDEGAEIKAFSSAFSSNTQTFFDVSEQSNEEIIEKSDILLIQGRRMFLSNADKEISAFADCKRTSPISFKYDVCPHSLDFLNWDFSKYGLIVISQTHGMGNGSFQIEDSSTELISDYLLSLYYKDGKVTKVYNNFLDYSMTLGNLLYLYKVSPQIIGNKISNSNAIVYGNYCWSTGLSRWLTTRNTVFGYSTRSIYKKNIDYLIQFVSNMYNGRTFQEAIVPLKGYSSTNYVSLETENIIPGTNNPLSKQRYFSIKTDEITKRADNGNPIITGTINGYKNLKKDKQNNDLLNYLVYFHEGDGEFSPKNAKEDECMVLKIPEYNDISDFTIDKNGIFSFEFPGFLKTGTKYQMIFAFEYSDNIFYGETKYVVPEAEDNEETITEGELIDLGLSVKWASCNFGATAPTELGLYYDEYDYFIDGLRNEYRDLVQITGYQEETGEISGTGLDPVKILGAGWRMPTLAEMEELKTKCKWKPVVIKDTPGFKVIGSNGNSIFFPSTDIVQTDMGTMGTLYSFGGSYYSGTYLNGMQGLMFQGIAGPEELTSVVQPVITLGDVSTRPLIRPVHD